MAHKQIRSATDLAEQLQTVESEVHSTRQIKSQTSRQNTSLINKLAQQVAKKKRELESLRQKQHTLKQHSSSILLSSRSRFSHDLNSIDDSIPKKLQAKRTLLRQKIDMTSKTYDIVTAIDGLKTQLSTLRDEDSKLDRQLSQLEQRKIKAELKKKQLNENQIATRLEIDSKKLASFKEEESVWRTKIEEENSKYHQNRRTLLDLEDIEKEHKKVITKINRTLAEVTRMNQEMNHKIQALVDQTSLVQQQSEESEARIDENKCIQDKLKAGIGYLGLMLEQLNSANSLKRQKNEEMFEVLKRIISQNDAIESHLERNLGVYREFQAHIS